MREKIKITALDHYGRGIGKIYNKIVFVENALINEEVEIEITNNKNSYCEAKVTDYVKKSNNRINAACQYYEICGGCNIMHMSYDEQLLFKKNKIKEILSKFAGIDTNITEIIGSDEFNYRNKVTLQVKNKLGFYKDSSYEIIAIDECLISSDNINKVIKILKKLDLTNINQIIVRTSNTNEIMVVLCLYGRIDEKYFADELKNSCTFLLKRYKNEYKVLFGSSYITEIIGDYKFNLSADSFFQVNIKQTHKMYELIKEYVGSSNNVLDLYCGTGTIGIYLSKNVKKITGIEINKSAIRDAIRNANINGIKNINFSCGNVKDLLSNIKNIDAIIVDPPRSGLDKETIKHILKINPAKIIYVSCDPLTLTRDLNILKKSYEVKAVTPIDMFPNTYHVECVILMSRVE